MLARHHDLRHTHGDPKGSGGIAAPMLVHQACHGRRAADLGTPSVFDDNVSARHRRVSPARRIMTHRRQRSRPPFDDWARVAVELAAAAGGRSRRSETTAAGCVVRSIDTAPPAGLGGHTAAAGDRQPVDCGVPAARRPPALLAIGRWQAPVASPGPLWTDDYSNVFRVLTR
jgi:hypothetical protein